MLQYGRVTAVVRFDEETQARLGCACLIRFENKAIAQRVIEAHVGDANWGVSVCLIFLLGLSTFVGFLSLYLIMLISDPKPSATE